MTFTVLALESALSEAFARARVTRLGGESGISAVFLRLAVGGMENLDLLRVLLIVQIVCLDSEKCHGGDVIKLGNCLFWFLLYPSNGHSPIKRFKLGLGKLVSAAKRVS